MKIAHEPVSGWYGVDTPPMSQRSQMAMRGSRPIAACSAACAAPGTGAAVELLDHLDVGHVARLRVVVGVRRPDQRGAALQVELRHLELFALVQVDRAGVDGEVR